MSKETTHTNAPDWKQVAQHTEVCKWLSAPGWRASDQSQSLPPKRKYQAKPKVAVVGEGDYRAGLTTTPQGRQKYLHFTDKRLALEDCI